MNLIIEKGYERVSIKDITERAGVDRTTFYLHFKDKHDLFERSKRFLVDELMELRERSGGPFPGITITFEHMAHNAEAYLAIWRSEGIASPANTFDEYIAKSMLPVLEPILRENGISDSSLSLPLAHYLAGALHSLSRWWLEAGMPKSSQEMTKLFIALATNGIASLANRSEN
jgi:AcrR family transcriptional regulator